MDTYFLLYMCGVLVYGIYLCVTTEDYQISNDVTNDAINPKKTNLRSFNYNYNYTDIEKMYDYHYQRKMI